MGWFDRLHCGMGTQGPSRVVRQLSANQCRRRPLVGVWDGSAAQHTPITGTDERLGLACAVPAWRHSRSGRTLHAAHDEGDADLRGCSSRAAWPQHRKRLWPCCTCVRIYDRMDGLLLRIAQLHADLHAEIPEALGFSSTMVKYRWSPRAARVYPIDGQDLRPGGTKTVAARMLPGLHRATFPGVQLYAVGNRFWRACRCANSVRRADLYVLRTRACRHR